MKIKFYGVRGSIPAPLTGEQVEKKIAHAIRIVQSLEAAGYSPPKPLSKEEPTDPVGPDATMVEWVQKHIQRNVRSTYGGNTTCVEVRCGDYPLILDMGTGLRELGKAMMPEIFANKGINGTILQSHVHWDHINGMPFWAPLFLPNSIFKNTFKFLGGKDWDSKLEDVLQGQMEPPLFPVNLKELQQTAMSMNFNTIWDGWTNTLTHKNNDINIKARKLFHPQETFGYEIKYGGNKFVFTTDHEPYYEGIPNGLKDLVNGADCWVTDCQYDLDMYLGKKDGVQKMSWGHSTPQYIAKVGKECGVKLIYTTHHDPSSTDREIEIIADTVEAISGITTMPAYEGLEIKL